MQLPVWCLSSSCAVCVLRSSLRSPFMPRGLNSFSCFYCMFLKRIHRSLAAPADAPNQLHPRALPLHLTPQVGETCSHHSLSPPRGELWGQRLSFGSAKATCSSGLQKNSHSLSGTRWGAPSFLCSLVLPRRLLSDLSSQGLVKITWQGRVKEPDGPGVPRVPQTSTDLSVSLKWRGHWKKGRTFRAKGSAITEFAAKLQDESTSF